MDENKIYKCINTERLNIVEPDGTLKLCLFNSQNIPPALMDGEDLLPGHRQDWAASGIIFFNTEGDECGGLVCRSAKNESGGYSSDLSMTFDRYKNDEVVSIAVHERDGARRYGFSVYDKPEGHIKDLVTLLQKMRALPEGEEKSRLMEKIREGNATRMFMGKKTDESVGIWLHDKAGNVRIQLYVDSDGEAFVEKI